MTVRFARLKFPTLAGMILVVSLVATTQPAAATDHAWWFFLNGNDPTNSGLYREQSGSWVDSWRSGSGNGTSTDRCKTGVGPLPSGIYAYPANPMHYFVKTSGDPGVRGPVIELGNKQCGGAGSTIRTELFIHTRFPWPGNSGYKSNGCVKLRNTGGNPSNGSGASGDIVTVTFFHALRELAGQRMSLYSY